MLKLEYAAAELKGDREIVLAAVAQDGWALECAAAELQGVREIVRIVRRVARSEHASTHPNRCTVHPSSKHRGPRNKCSWSGHDAHPTAGPARR